MSERKPRRTFTKEFKNQMVQLYASLKKYSDNGIKIKKNQQMPRIVALMSALISFDKRNKGLWFPYKPNEEEQKNEYRTKTEGRKKERRVIPGATGRKAVCLQTGHHQVGIG